LWADAVRLAQVLPLTRVAQQLGLTPAARAWQLASVAVEVQRPAGVRLRSSYRDPAPVLTLRQPLLAAR
jgi:hypothetical protein